MTVRNILKEWLNMRVMKGMDTVSSHEFEELKMFGIDVAGKMHNVDTYTRDFRKMREVNDYPPEVIGIKKLSNGGKESTWRLQTI